MAVLTSHPVQYYAPLFQHLALRLDLHVFFAHSPSPDQQSAAGFGTAFEWDVDLVSGYSHSFLRNVAKAPSAAQFSGCDTPEIGAKLRAGGFDAVLSLGWHMKSLLQGALAAKSIGLPVLIRGDSQLSTPRGSLKRWAKGWTYPAFLRLFDSALYVGDRNHDYYRHYGYPETRLFWSPHCVDTKRFSENSTPQARQTLRARLGIDHKTRLILFAGKLLPFKRPLDVVLATSALRKRGIDAHVMIAGSGELETEVGHCARALGVQIHMLGFQNQSQMPAAYAAADALVLPSTGRETWGLVCNEALACGTPIVVSDAVGCAPDLASDGYVGRIFPVGNVASCASALSALFEAPPRAAEIAAVSDGFTVSAAADGIISALQFATQKRFASRLAESAFL